MAATRKPSAMSDEELEAALIENAAQRSALRTYALELTAESDRRTLANDAKRKVARLSKPERDALAAAARAADTEETKHDG